MLAKFSPLSMTTSIAGMAKATASGSPMLSHAILSGDYVAKRWCPGRDPVSQYPRMFASQYSLPRLPIPPLSQTLEKYLRYVQPLVPENDFQYTKKIVERFGESKGEGQELQKLLIERAKKTDSWLAHWWLHAAYLDFRSPVVVHSNPGVRFRREMFASEDDWLLFAARLVRGVLDYKTMVDGQTVPVDKLGGSPLCMKQYYALLSSCRIPGERRDSVVCHHPAAGTETSGCAPTHICVAHNNRYFHVEVCDSHGHPVNVHTIFMQLRAIVDRSPVKGQPIGLMTAENRNVWGQAYQRLNKFPVNRASFASLHRSIFLLCLDHPIFSGVPQDAADSICATNMLHGNGHKANSANRWFDKTLQLIVSSDGACGLNYEHSPAEGPPVITILNHAYNYLGRSATGRNHHEDVGLPAPMELAFSLDQQTRIELDMAKTNIASLVRDLELEAVNFSQFGKSAIQAFRISPDAFFQVGLQLAYARLHGRPCATYESGSTRRFQLGRTDTIRSCGPESVRFTRAMQDNAVSEHEKRTLMLTAMNSHRQYTDEVVAGQGIDRHLLGLKLIAIENGHNVPEMFMDVSYTTATHYNLSTSQVTSKVEAAMCFGPVVPDGYGVCYNPQADRILVNLSAFRSNPVTSARDLARSLETALVDMHTLLRTPQAKI